MGAGGAEEEERGGDALLDLDDEVGEASALDLWVASRWIRVSQGAPSWLDAAGWGGWAERGGMVGGGDGGEGERGAGP